jgi:hypothetical protein
MTIANVNNCGRQMMADVRTLAAADTIASATTCDLGTKDATFLTVSGTTTITGLGTVSAGIYKFVVFSGALTLTHNATSLILPGAANITTVAGDTGLFLSLGSGNWRCMYYQAATVSYQPLDSDLTAIAALTTTATGRSLLAIADAAAGRTILASAAEASTQTIYIPAGAMKADPTAGPSIATVELANGPNITTLDFDTASDEHAQFAIRMPKGWDEGTVTFVPSWSHPATTTNFGVAWFLQAVAIGNDDTLNVAFGTAVSSKDTGGTTNDLYIGPASSAMTIAGTPAAEDLVQFQIYRDVSDAGDTLAVDARLHGITVYYTTTSLSDA